MVKEKKRTELLLNKFTSFSVCVSSERIQTRAREWERVQQLGIIRLPEQR